jgi:phospholipid/cholesterol/gamma-HCH transport system substrate-binding protein
MRTRTVREGSIGLLILLGLAVFGGIFLWLRGLSPGRRSYEVTIRFPNAEGMQVGAPVLYRGVAAGKISAIRVNANYAEVDARISPATVIMPKDVTIEAQQSGLVGQTYIDIVPNKTLPESALTSNPLAADCNRELIVCNGSQLQGAPGATLTALLGSMIQFTNLFSSPEFFGNLQTLTKNFASAAKGVDTLSGEVTILSKSVRGEVGTLSNSAQRSANSVGIAAEQLGVTAKQFGLTADQVTALITSNRSTLVSTLDNLNQTVLSVQTIAKSLEPAFAQGDFTANLQTLSANAAAASTSLRNLSEAVGTPDNLLLLQQTLDSARATFQNAQKITSDLDELTGDPSFRQNVRRLVNGLGRLVSSTQELQQQTQIARMLSPASTALVHSPGFLSATDLPELSAISKPGQPSQQPVLEQPTEQPEAPAAKSAPSASRQSQSNKKPPLPVAILNPVPGLTSSAPNQNSERHTVANPADKTP